MHFRFSKKWGVLDYKVYLSFIVVAFLSLGLFSYRVATRVNCPDIKFSLVGKLAHAKENTFNINEDILFNTGLDTALYKIVWDFGDNTEKHTNAVAYHSYATAGSYEVIATINGVCKESVLVRITESASNVQGFNVPIVNPIVSNDVLKMGDENLFSSSVNADAYEWSVEELPDLGKLTTPIAKFIFTRGGNYTILLKLGDGQRFTKLVQVIDPVGNLGNLTPLPPPTTVSTSVPPPPVIEDLPPIKKEEPKIEQKQEPEESKPEPPVVKKSYDLLPLPAIQAMLEDVTEGKKDVADFNSQLCNGAGTKVLANDRPTTFAGLCMELKKKRKKMLVFKKEKSITSVKVVRDENNGNCITLMYVNYK